MSSSEIAKLEHRWRENRQGLSFAPLAEAYRKMGEPARALEVLAEGLSVNPNYIPASIVLGRTHLDLGDDGQAEAAFERVLELDAENVIALRALADIAERARRLTDARGRLETLLHLDRGNEEARVQLEQIVARIDAGEPADGVGADSPAVGDAADVAAVAERGIDLESGIAEAAEPPADVEAGEPEPMAAEGFEWEPAPELPSPDEVEPDPSIELQEHLVPEAEVAPLDDLVVDDAPSITDENAGAEAMRGLVGQDFQEHSAGVVPLDDLNSGSGGLPDFDAIERPSELELHPSDTNEFQAPSAADELAANVDSESVMDAPGDWDDEVPFEGLDAGPVSDRAGEPASPGVETVASSFGAESLADETEGAPPEGQLDELAGELDDEPARMDDDADDLEPADEFGWDDEAPAESGGNELVVTESMAELYLRQGHRKEALAVYRLLYQRSPDDFRLRERVDELETEVAAAMTSPAAAPAPPVSLQAPDEARTVGTLLRRLLQHGPSEPAGGWEEAVASAPRPLEVSDAAGEEPEALPTRPAGDHLSLSDVFGDEGSPVPPAVSSPSASGNGEDGMSFDAFFGEGDASAARSRAPARDDDDLDQFQAWLQNLKR